jgi:hypothetical protein
MDGALIGIPGRLAVATDAHLNEDTMCLVTAGKRVFGTNPLETVPWLLNVLAAENNLGLAALAGALVLFAVDGDRGVPTLPDEPGWSTISRMLVTGH